MSHGSMSSIRGRAARISTAPSSAATAPMPSISRTVGQVVGQPGHQVAGLHALEVRQRQPLQVGEELVPQVPLDVAGEAEEDVGPPEIPEYPLAGGGQRDQAGKQQEVPPAARPLGQVVDRQTGEPREREVHDIGGEKGQDAEDKSKPAMPVQDWGDVLGKSLPMGCLGVMIGFGKGLCNGSAEFASRDAR